MRIYHNPRCSKSRGTLALLEEAGVTPEIIHYLDTPPTRAELVALLAKLGMQPSELVRRGEDICKTEYAGRTMSEDDWLDAMLAHPVLIERPIVVAGERAVIGRPPEKVLELLDV
ncbi:arsenate reductase (glutaredoxin) [Pseudazoarcus pumilus]|uniref:Arsenate reductase n=1 Tax=Pseudazoarcus pumilus TaxID=2067960 RepID=A0A2I6S6N9_9RHOO|nr:arsenate reductase (glutaredoxin) [Pseudazoarcus pumilus]AUN94920.1 arsenate reductase (glutaredoxin) [Pseudazoarcus pumilus]